MNNDWRGARFFMIFRHLRRMNTGWHPLSYVNMIRYKEFIFKNNPIKFVHLLKKSLNLQQNINKHYREETSYTKVCE